MPSLEKLLIKFNKKERALLQTLIEQLVSLDWQGLDVKKLKGYQNLFRVRKGKLRIVFSQNKEEINILAIKHRSEKTYKNF